MPPYFTVYGLAYIRSNNRMTYRPCLLILLYFYFYSHREFGRQNIYFTNVLPSGDRERRRTTLNTIGTALISIGSSILILQRLQLVDSVELSAAHKPQQNKTYAKK